MKFEGLWRHPEFVRLWSGQTVSVFGSLIGRTALPFTAILVLDARPYEMALLAAADIVPGLAIGLVAGVWVDRLLRRPVLIAADLGRAALLLTIPAAYALDALAMEQLYLVALGTGMLTMIFDVAYLAYLPSLVQREELLEGNSKLAASESVAEVGAFGVAGWLVQLLTGPGAILIDAVSFVISALFVRAIRKPEPPPAPPHEREGVVQEAVEGLRTIRETPVLMAIAGSEAMIDFSGRIFGVAFMLYVTRDLGFGTGVLGMIFAVGGISSLAGALVARPATRRLGVGPAMVIGLALMGVSQLFVPLAQGATILGATFLIAQQVVGDGSFTVYHINQVSARQTITSDRLLGRVTAGMRFAGKGAMLLGALVGGVLGELIGLRGTLIIGAAGMLAAALWLAASPVRGLREAPVLDAGVAPAVSEAG